MLFFKQATGIKVAVVLIIQASLFNLECNSSILFFIVFRIIQNRIIMAVICLAILGVIGLIIYYATK